MTNRGSKSSASRSLLLFASSLAVITYVDRVCIAQAAPRIREDLGLSAAQMGMAFSVFAWAYALFEIPGGWLGDRIGPKPVLIRVVVLWSVFTGATGYVWNLGSLLAARFLFGMGEAGCFPNITKAFSLWLPPDQQTRAHGILWLSARWGGAFTPLLVIWVMTWLSWRHTFVLFGALGLVWAFIFSRGFKPASSPIHAVEGMSRHANPGEPSRSRVQKIPWRKLFVTRSVLLLWAQYFCLTYGWFFYVTWLPTYLKETRGMELNRNPLLGWLEATLGEMISPDRSRLVWVAVLAGIPLFFGGLGCWFAGWITPYLARWFQSTTKARQLLGIIGFVGAGGLLLGSFYIGDPLWAMLAMGFAGLCNDLTMPGSWSACVDLGGEYAGTLSGSMNMMGSVGAALAPFMIGLILDASGHHWEWVFWMSGIVYLLGAICWVGIRTETAVGGFHVLRDSKR